LRRWRSLAAALALVAVPAAPAAARADDEPTKPQALPVRPAQIALEQGVVKISETFRDVIDAEITRKLLSGLPTVVTMRGYLYAESGSSPIALAARSCRVIYDTWDDVFDIRLVQPGGSSQTAAANVEGVLRNCCDVKKLPLVDRALLASGVRYFVTTMVEINPVSQEMLDRIKRWVTRPNGGSGIGPGDSLFGSFVGLFVARIRDADRKLAFRSASFTPPNPPPPP
jgi:hypothetical protein